MRYDEPLLDVAAVGGAAHVTSVRCDEHDAGDVTVAFDAQLPDDAIGPAAAADLLHTRGPGPDGAAPAERRAVAWQARWWYRRPSDTTPRLALHVRIDGPELGYAIDFVPLTRWDQALERAERARRLRIELTCAPPDEELPIVVTLTFEPDGMALPMDGLAEFARDWRRPGGTISQPPDSPT